MIVFLWSSGFCFFRYCWLLSGLWVVPSVTQYWSSVALFLYIFFELLTIDIGRFIKSHQFCTLDEVLMSFNYNDDANNCSFCGINL